MIQLLLLDGLHPFQFEPHGSALLMDFRIVLLCDYQQLYVLRRHYQSTRAYCHDILLSQHHRILLHSRRWATGCFVDLLCLVVGPCSPRQCDSIDCNYSTHELVELGSLKNDWDLLLDIHKRIVFFFFFEMNSCCRVQARLSGKMMLPMPPRFQVEQFGAPFDVIQ
jgi:hypothetical protein